jgi:hypothetical protein
MAVATWEDVAVALGRPTSDFTADQQAQLTYWLNGVELFIKNRLGVIADLDEDTVRYVETEVAADKARRLTEDGASSVTVAIPDGSITRRFEKVVASDITDDYWAMFGSAYGGSAYTIPVSSSLDLA